MGNIINPLVTVIIPVYNHAEYVEECIMSVINQTYSNLQIIIINDGSIDKSEEVVKEVINKKKQNRNIEFYSQTNQGVCKTLNMGLELSKGKYIASIGSDDIWVSEKIEKQVDFLEKNQNVGIVFTDGYYIKFHEKSNIKHTDYKPEIKKYFLNGIQNVNIHEKLLYNCFISAITVMMRKKHLDFVGYYDKNLRSEDYDMWLRFTRHYPIGFIDEPLAYHRVHDSNASGNILQSFPEIGRIVFKNYKEGSLKNKPIKAIFVYITFFIKAAINRIRRAHLIK